MEQTVPLSAVDLLPGVRAVPTHRSAAVFAGKVACGPDRPGVIPIAPLDADGLTGRLCAMRSTA